MKTNVQPENERDKRGSRIQYDIFTNNHPKQEKFWFPHTHTYFETILILEGELFCKVEDHEPFALHKGDVLFVPPHIIHDTYMLHPIGFRSIVVKFSPLFLYPMETTQSDLECMLTEPTFERDYYYFESGSPIAEALSGIMRKCLEEKTQKVLGYEMALRGCLIDLYITLLRNCGTPHPLSAHQEFSEDSAQLMHRIMTYLQENYQYNISMQEVADVCGISYYHFSRFFKKMTNKKFTEYLLEMRLNFAQKKLLQEDHSVSDVALECGFEYVSYFIQKFRDRTGLTPKEFRKKHREAYAQGNEKK